MTDHTFLLKNYSTFSIRNIRFGLIAFGLLVLVFSLAELLSSTELQTSTNPFLILLGGNFLLIGTLGLSKKSRYSPKIKITEDQIIIKEKIFSRQKALAWSTLEKIEFGSYSLLFFKPNHSFTFKLDTTKETSIAIKQALRKIGESKNIVITGN
ncbi:MAG: hypothetical protein ACJA2N_001431 [Salibacteraceae bacterium]|jgi:hypothetical protein